jgi:hypothetical protein
VNRQGRIPYELDSFRPDVDMANSSNFAKRADCQTLQTRMDDTLKLSWIAPIDGTAL